MVRPPRTLPGQLERGFLGEGALPSLQEARGGTGPALWDSGHRPAPAGCRQDWGLHKLGVGLPAGLGTGRAPELLVELAGRPHGVGPAESKPGSSGPQRCSLLARSCSSDGQPAPQSSLGSCHFFHERVHSRGTPQWSTPPPSPILSFSASSTSSKALPAQDGVRMETFPEGPVDRWDSPKGGPGESFVG